MQSETDLNSIDVMEGKAGIACMECERWFRNQTQLKSHMWRHTGEKPYACIVCQRRFTQQGNLKAHMRIHTGEKPYVCTQPDCGAKFTQRSNLKAHTKIHTGEKPFKCSYCASAFRQATNLRTHLAIHTGERPYQCAICYKSFTQKSNLKAHRDRVHRAYKVTQQNESVTLSIGHDDSFYNNLNIVYAKDEQGSFEMPSQNEIIVEMDNSVDYSLAPTVEILIPEAIMSKEEPFEFHSEKTDFGPMEIGIPCIKEEPNLDIEIVEGNIENPYSCEICYNTYLSDSDLRIHQCIKGLRYFQCDLCKDSLRTLADLKNHQASHSEGKRYRCSLCGLIFISHKKLRSHHKLHKTMIGARANDCISENEKCPSNLKYKSFSALKQSHSNNQGKFAKTLKILKSKSSNYATSGQNLKRKRKTKRTVKNLTKFGQFCKRAKVKFLQRNVKLSRRELRQSLSLHYAVSYKHFLILQRKFLRRQGSKSHSSLTENSKFIESKISCNDKASKDFVSEKDHMSPLFMCYNCKSYFCSLGDIKSHMEIHRKKKTIIQEQLNKNLNSQNVFVISACLKYDEPIAQISRIE